MSTAGSPNLIKNLSCQLAAEFLKPEEQNGERSENNAKLKTFCTFVYNSEAAKVCVFGFVRFFIAMRTRVIYSNLEFY